MHDKKEKFEQLIKRAIKDNNMEVLYMLVATLISADNNLTEEELTENCKDINILVEVLENYKDLQEIREMLIDYKNNIIL